MKQLLILPGCDDTNRGDQALIWETVKVARDSGFEGKFYMVADKEKALQSYAEGINQMDYILPHPSSHFKTNENVTYGFSLKIKWAMVSLIDAIKAVTLLSKVGRFILKPFLSEKKKKSLEIYENSDIAFVKGGGFLHSYGGIVNTYSNFYDLYPVILAQKMGKKVYFMPNSFGPFLSPGAGKLIKRVLNKCELVTCRESISQEMLKNELAVNSKLFPDLAFFLEMDKNLNEQQMKKFKACLSSSKKNIALTIRPYRFPGAENPEKSYENYKQAICDFVRYLSDNNYHAVLIEHTFSGNTHEQDMSCINEVAEMLDDSVDYSVYSDLSLTCRQLKYIYSNFDYIVGTRFHSIIFSLAAKVPAIAITYGGNKGQGIMNDIGLSEYTLPIDELNASSLIDLFNKITNNAESVQNVIDTFIKENEKKRTDLIELIRGNN